MVKCKICGKQIEAHQLLLHESYCEKNSIKCDRCGLLYDKNYKELHDEEFHQLQWCKTCNKTVHDLTTHICGNNQIQCKYCSLYFPSIEYQDHEIFCGSRTERCSYCFNFIMIRDLNFHQHNCPQNVQRPKQQEDQGLKNIKIQEIQKNEMNSPYSNYGSNYNQNQALLQQNPLQLLQQGKQFIDQMQIARPMLDSKYQAIFAYGPNTPYTQSQEYSQFEMEQQQNSLYNQQFQQQFQFQQNQNNQNKNLNRMDNQGGTFQNFQVQQGTDFEQNFAQDQQFNSNIIMGNPKMDEVGLKNQMQVNQNKQIQPQQMKQEHEKKKIFEDRNIQNNDTKNSINDSDCSDSIIGRILLESIQADQLQMSYAQYKQLQKIQEQMESQKQQQAKPNILNQNQATSIETEFAFLSEQEKNIQRWMMEIIQNQRN